MRVLDTPSDVSRKCLNFELTSNHKYKMEKIKVIIIGGKGAAVSIAEMIDDAHNRFGMNIEVLGFAFDDPKYKEGINGWPVLCGTREAYSKYKDDPTVFFVFAIYLASLIKERAALRDSYGIPRERYLTFVHPSSYVAKSAILGAGCIIAVNCIIDSNVVIGDFNMLRSNVHINHDATIDTCNYLGPSSVIGSASTIGKANFTGINSSVRPGRTIGDNNFIAMAANVVKDIGDNQLAIGNPAVNKNR